MKNDIWMKVINGGVLVRNETEFTHEISKAGFNGGIKFGKGDSQTLAKLWKLLESGFLSMEPRGRTLCELAKEGKL